MMHHIPCTVSIRSSLTGTTGGAASSVVRFILRIRAGIRPLLIRILCKGVSPGHNAPHVNGESNQATNYRVRVSARTALASTAILTLTLGAATARERALRPHRQQQQQLLPTDHYQLFLFFLLCSFFFYFYPLSGIWRDAFRLVMV